MSDQRTKGLMQMLNLKNNYDEEKLAIQFYYLCKRSYEQPFSWTIDQLEEDLYARRSEYLVWENQGEILGFLSCHFILDEVEVTNVAVDPAYQRQGIGQILFKELLHICAEKKIHKIFLEVRKSNRKAQNLYQKMGFAVIHTRKNYYHAPVEDAFVMCFERK